MRIYSRKQEMLYMNYAFCPNFRLNIAEDMCENKRKFDIFRKMGD